MKYELAKQLKDAGFPMNRTVGEYVYDYAPDKTGDEQMLSGILVPTLSELIEACEPTDNYCVLLNITKSWSVASRGTKSAGGSTPKEAVANLYLALHES